MRTLLTTAATLALALAGTAAAATWPKHEPNAADQALAKRSVVRLADLGSGARWTSVPARGGGGNLDDPSCHGPAFSDVGRVITGSAEASFKTTGLQVWSSAEVMKTIAMARHDARRSKSSTVLPCLSAILRKSLPGQARLVSLKELQFPGVGDWSDAYRAIVDVTVSGRTVRLQVDVVLVQASRVEITLMQLAPYALSSEATDAEDQLVVRLASSADGA